MRLQKQLRQLLIEEDYQAIAELAAANRRVLSYLTALTYEPDRLLVWRAIEAIGLAAARVADADDPEVVRVHLRRYQWLLNDESGGIGWHFPEAMGSILYRRPRQFAEFIPIVVSLFEMEEEDVRAFRPGILWAVGRIAQVMPERVERTIPRVIPCLDDPHPQTRGMAAWCLGQLQATDPLAGRDDLRQDESPVEIFRDGQLVQTTVAALTEEALAS